MNGKEFLKSKGITKCTCYTNAGFSMYVDDLAKLLDEFKALRQPDVKFSYLKFLSDVNTNRKRIERIMARV